MALIREQFEIPGKMRTWSFALIGIGILALIIGFIIKGAGTDEHQKDIFWGTLMYNSLFFMLICNGSMFFICATTLAMGGWYTVLRRVPEAISTMVPVFGLIAFIVLLYIVFGTHIYQWADAELLKKENDEIVLRKLGFLNPGFFFIWTILAIGLWSLLGWRMRRMSSETDVWFGLTVASTVPWLWMMSIDAAWYSTMYSWYTFASSFVSGMALVTLWVIYLKNKGYLEYTNEEHLHNLGIFIFAFSIFWTYLWFSQYMLIWYGNIPEESIYFKHRIQGPYKGIFFLNLIINFICPLLILMKRSSKRNYTLMTFMAVLILFGHWIDFYQMVMGSISKEWVTLGWLDFGIAALFIGLMIFFVSKALVKKPLVPKYNPFLKESIIHYT